MLSRSIVLPELTPPPFFLSVPSFISVLLCLNIYFLIFPVCFPTFSCSFLASDSFLYLIAVDVNLVRDFVAFLSFCYPHNSFLNLFLLFSPILPFSVFFSFLLSFFLRFFLSFSYLLHSYFFLPCFIFLSSTISFSFIFFLYSSLLPFPVCSFLLYFFLVYLSFSSNFAFFMC
jgi:hypothetical protein